MNYKEVNMWIAIGKIAFTLLITRILWSIIKGFYGSFLAATLGLNFKPQKNGKWAVVTGATDGIGKAYAIELARKGMSIVLISRTPYKLQNVATEIQTNYKVETKIIDVDFTRTDIYDRIKKELAGLDIGVLVNNVGMSSDYPEYYIDVDNGDKVCENLINCNIISVTHMTRIVLPGMAERRRGAIINVSSLAATVPSPLLTVYASTKCFVESFSKGLAMEYANQNVTVQCVMPGFVVSNMSKLKRSSLMAPMPTTYVRSALNTTGIESRTGGYFMHKLQIYFIEIASQYLPGFVVNGIIFDQLRTIRSKALKRKAKEAKKE